MEISVLWTPKARSGLEQVIDYLQENWSHTEILKLEKKLYSVLELIKEQPELFPVSELYARSRKALVDKNNFLIYRLNPARDPDRNSFVRRNKAGKISMRKQNLKWMLLQCSGINRLFFRSGPALCHEVH